MNGGQQGRHRLLDRPGLAGAGHGPDRGPGHGAHRPGGSGRSRLVSCRELGSGSGRKGLDRMGGVGDEAFSSMATDATPSAMAWCSFITNATRPPSRPSTMVISHSGRSPAEPTPAMSGDDPVELALAARRVDVGGAKVTRQVELGVVDDRRVPQTVGRG